MLRNWRVLLAILLILTLSWIDYQYYTEAPMAYFKPAEERRLYHFFCLAAIAAIGYWGLYKHPLRWVKKLFVFFYALAIIIILITTVLNSKLGWFSQDFLNAVSEIRIVFCSPLPFFIVYAVAVSINRLEGANKK